VKDEAAAPTSAAPPAPDIDDSGVDLAQIRAMLDRRPGERLTLMTRFTTSLLAARARNGTPGSS
jgi:hypothetical protein